MGATWGLVVFAALLSCVCGSLTFNGAAWTTFLGNSAPGVDIPNVHKQIVSGPGGLYYFLACPASIGCGLFSTSDGATFNTIKVFYPSAALDSTGAQPHCCLTALTVNGKQEIWFGAKTLQNGTTLTPTGLEPWRSDGTAANTVMVSNLDNAVGSSMASTAKLFALATPLVAIADSDSIYVWNDVTKTSSKISPPAQSAFSNFLVVGSMLFYAITNAIYKYDGVAAPSIIRTLAAGNVRTLSAIPSSNNWFTTLVTSPGPLSLQFTKIDGSSFTPTLLLAPLSASNYILETTSTGLVYYGCYKDAAAKAAGIGSICKIDGTPNTMVEGTVAFDSIFPHRGLFKITTNGQFAFGFTSPGGAVSVANPVTTNVPFTQFNLLAGTTFNGVTAPQTQNFFNNDKFALGPDYIIQLFNNFNQQTNQFWMVKGAANAFGQLLNVGKPAAVLNNVNSAPVIISANKALYVYGSSLLTVDLTTANTDSPLVLDSTKVPPFLPAPQGGDMVAFAAQLGGKTFIPSNDANGVAKIYQVSATGLTLAPGSPTFQTAAPSWCVVNTKAGGVLLFVAINPNDAQKRDFVAFDGTTFTVLSSGQANTNRIYYCQYIPDLDRTVFASSPNTAAGELWVTDHKTAAGTVGVVPAQVAFPAGATLDTSLHPVYFNNKLYLGLVIGGASVLYTLTVSPTLALAAFQNNNVAQAVTGGNLYAHGTNLYWTDTTQLMCFSSAGAGTFTQLNTFNAKTITSNTQPLASMGTAVIFKEVTNSRFLRVKGCQVDKAFDYGASLKETFPKDHREAPYFVYYERDATAGDKFYIIGENDDSNGNPVLTWADAMFAVSSNSDRKPFIHGKNLFFIGDANTPLAQKQVYRVPFPAGLKRVIANFPTTRLAAVSGLGATPLGNNAQLVGFEVTNINGAPVPFLQDSTAAIQGGAPLVVIPNPLTLTPANQPAIYKSVGPAGATQQAFYPRTYTLQRNAADGWEVPFAKVNGLITSSSITAAAGVTATVDGTSTFLTFDALAAQPSVSFTYVPNFNFGAAVINQFTHSAATGATEAATASATTIVTFKQFNFPTAPGYAPNPFRVDPTVKTTFTLTAVNAEPFYYIDNIANGQVFADNVALPAAGGFVAANAVLQFQSTAGQTTGSFRVRSATMNVVTNPLSDVVANNEVVVSVAVNPPSPTPTVSPTPSVSPSPGSGSGSGGSTAQNLVTISVSFDRLISA